MNLETIILSKLTQEQKIKHCMFSLIGGLNNENSWTQGGEHNILGFVGGRNKGGVAGVGRLGRDNMRRNARYR